MASIEITGLDDLIRGLGILATDQIPFATAKTLTQVAGIAKNNVVTEMQRVFDRPTSFTLNAFTTRAATKSNLVSKVQLRDPTRIDDDKHYLNPQATGGKRAFKTFEAALYRIGVLPAGYYTVPAAGATIDSYGNMSRGQIVQILSFFQAFTIEGFKANTTPDGKTKLAKSTIRKYGIDYFYILPGTKNGLKPGIYQSIYSNWGRAIKPVLIYVRATTYQQKLNVERIADETYNKNFDDLFKQNFIDAINTAIPKK